MTQNQLIELIESEQVKALVERSEERGFIEPAEFEAFTLEHDLNDDETEQLTRELETLGLEVGQRAAKDKEKAARTDPGRPSQTWRRTCFKGKAREFQPRRPERGRVSSLHLPSNEVLFCKSR